jgi:hypothetical protein
MSDTQTTQLNPQQHFKRAGVLLIDTTAKARLPGPQNPGECHIAEGVISIWPYMWCRISGILENVALALALG